MKQDFAQQINHNKDIDRPMTGFQFLMVIAASALFAATFFAIAHIMLVAQLSQSIH